MSNVEKIEALKGKKILVLGLGREGLATVRFLAGISAEIGLADRRTKDEFTPEEREILNVAEKSGAKMYLGENYLSELRNFEMIIKSPGISIMKNPLIAEAVKAGVELTSATNIFFSNVKGKVIAVTGSKGKSTTSSLIYAVLKETGFDVELVGNIGRPALDFLGNDASGKHYVYEISSYQLEDFSGSPDIAVLVSFFPEHLDYHGDEKAYLSAKMQIAGHLKKESKLIYNFASEKLRAEVLGKFGVEKNEQVLTFNNGETSRIDEKNCLVVDGHQIICLSDIVLFGVHNLENILAVCEVAKVLGIDLIKVAKVVSAFKGLEHRLEEVGTFKGILFYNDAISTTPESTMAALEAMKMRQSGRRGVVGTMIVGGLDRGYKFGKLTERIVEDEVENLILFADTGKNIADEVKKYAGETGKSLPQMVEVGGMEEAVQKAFEITKSGKICLLSCASPSFNLFKNFEDRGKQYKDWILKMG